jgi:hypothetical protein
VHQQPIERYLKQITVFIEDRLLVDVVLQNANKILSVYTVTGKWPQMVKPNGIDGHDYQRQGKDGQAPTVPSQELLVECDKVFHSVLDDGCCRCDFFGPFFLKDYKFIQAKIPAHSHQNGCQLGNVKIDESSSGGGVNEIA